MTEDEKLRLSIIVSGMLANDAGLKRQPRDVIASAKVYAELITGPPMVRTGPKIIRRPRKRSRCTPR